jgi:hypothetical protein
MLVRSLAPLLRGEGWGEGLFQQRYSPRVPLTRNSRVRISTSPRKRGEVKESPGASRKDNGKLLPVIRQNLFAGLAEPGAVLLQAGQHRHIAVIHHGAAVAGDIPRASGL